MVVEGDPVHDSLASLVVRGELPAVDAGRLEAVPQALSGGVALATALARHRAANPTGLESVRQVPATVLAAAIAEEDQAAVASAGVPARWG